MAAVASRSAMRAETAEIKREWVARDCAEESAGDWIQNGGVDETGAGAADRSAES